MQKLKEARKRDTMRLKAAALKEKNKAMAEERRAHNACTEQMEREVKHLKVIIQERKIMHLERTIKKRMRKQIKFLQKNPDRKKALLKPTN